MAKQEVAEAGQNGAVELAEFVAERDPGEGRHLGGIESHECRSGRITKVGIFGAYVENEGLIEFAFQGPTRDSSAIRFHDDGAEAQGQHHARDAATAGGLRRM